MDSIFSDFNNSTTTHPGQDELKGNIPMLFEMYGKQFFFQLLQNGAFNQSRQEKEMFSNGMRLDVEDSLHVTLAPQETLVAGEDLRAGSFPPLDFLYWQSLGLFVSVFIIRYLAVPCALLYLVCCLWEIYCVGLRDRTCLLPLPGGKMGLPLVGEMFHLFIFGANYQRQRRKKYGNIYRTHMFGSPTVVAIGDEHVKRLLLGEGSVVRCRWPSTTRRILGEDGIVNGDKETHHRIKRLSLKSFSPKYMGTYAPIVQTGIKEHLKEWRDQKEIPVLESCKQMVSKVMMTVLLGIDPNDPDIQLYIRAADDIINSILSLPLDLPGFTFRKGLRARKFVFDKLESELRSKFEATDEELFDESSQESPSVLLNVLKLARLEGEEKLKLRNLQNLALEFIFAGTQSLQCACSSMMVHLSQRPEVVARLRTEIKQHGLWETPMNEVTYEEIESLKFADCVVKETLRVTPTIPGAVRVATKTFELGGYQVPRGWQVMYSIRLTHEDTAGHVLQNGPKCEFDPDVYFNCKKCENTNNVNQQAENGKGSSSSKIREASHVCSKSAGAFSFIPFGKGSRMCAGKNYGLLFLRVLVFELVRTADLKLKGGCNFIEVPMTKPDKSVKVEILPIAKQCNV
ncbi:unnamed protein product [Clavelina lepadiformis]|uniref:Cytochrome P450 n=1 Tax=Clavelina lepadiformis TaxID=159417 RepID=A0ABP0GE91_CLALP